MSKCCCHDHCDSCNDEEKEERLEKKDIILYILSIIIFILTFIPFIGNITLFNVVNIKIVMYFLTIILSGYEIIIDGIKNIFKLNFEENTLMTIAVIAAFILGEFPESCMVILLFKLGEFIEDKAVDKSNDNIKNIVEIKAKTANLIDNNENVTIVDVEKVNINDKILIKPGEMVPVDCKIIKGKSLIDMSSITGESMPVNVSENTNILSGSINLNGSLTCVVNKDYKNSTAAQIIDLVNEATNNKGKTENFITKFSKIYTPIVIILAIIVAIIPPIIFKQEFKIWIIRALVFLVASCPCSIIISVPLAFFSCIGIIAKKGMLIKGTKHIESLANTNFIAFDKTGTITTGKMKIDKLILTGSLNEKEVLEYMYVLEKNSNHPISTAIKNEVENASELYSKEDISTKYETSNYEEIAGKGVKATINDKEVMFGNYKLLKQYNINKVEQKNANYLIINNQITACATFKEELRENIQNISKILKNKKIKQLYMLTGDNIENASNIAKQAGIEKVYANLMPSEKLDKVKELRKEGKVTFVGDGINDSPVLAEADFGIAMGEGTEIASSVADGILMSNNIVSLSEIIKIAKKSLNIIKFNIAFSLIIKLIVLTLGIIGIAPIWIGVAADTGVCLVTILNSIRILKS